MRDLSSYFKLQHKGGCNTHMELGKLELEPFLKSI